MNGRAATGFAFEFHVATMGHDDVARSRQAQPGTTAHRAGREEGLEGAFTLFGAHPDAVVGNLYINTVIGPMAADPDFTRPSAVLNGLNRITYEVVKQLVQVPGEADKTIQITEIKFKSDVGRELALDHADGVLERVVEIGKLLRRAIHIR